MSSTNRGYDRHKSDYYITPQKPINDFIKKYNELKKYNVFKDKRVLDPCAGGDKNHDMSYPKVISKYEPQDIISIDIREDSLAYIKEDFFSMDLDYEPDIIISNPPFYLAEEFIRKSINSINEKGTVIMLLRLNFLGSQKRLKFWEDYMPNYIFLHSKRMSFTDDNKTDSIEYAHFVWEGLNKTENSKLFVI